MNQQQKNILRDHLRYKANMEQERKDKENRPERSTYDKWKNDPMGGYDCLEQNDDEPFSSMG